MNKEQLFMPEWLSLSREVRAELIEMFDLKRDVSTEVCGGVVMCDGYSNQMLRAISMAAMKEKGIEGADFLEMFANLLKSLEPKLEPVVEFTPEEQIRVDDIVRRVEKLENKSKKLKK